LGFKKIPGSQELTGLSLTSLTLAAAVFTSTWGRRRWGLN